MTYETPDKFMTHALWCEWWINDETEICDCGYREDLYMKEYFEEESWKDRPYPRY